jgi:addiction module RelB/DinJ family antitoxin
MEFKYSSIGGVWIASLYLRHMSLITRTAFLQARVCPEIKFASEHVLRRIGLNLTEAMELFLRRIIIDQRLPFDVVALDEATLARVTQAWQAEIQGEPKIDIGASARSIPRRKRPKRE